MQAAKTWRADACDEDRRRGQTEDEGSRLANKLSDARLELLVRVGGPELSARGGVADAEAVHHFAHFVPHLKIRLGEAQVVVGREVEGRQVRARQLHF
eukprot:548388-Rhodomonas_salina.2